MSLGATVAAFEARGLSPVQRLVLLAYADHCDESGLCWPSQARVAERVEVSRQTVNRATKELAEMGLVTIEGRVGQDGGQTSNFVRIQISKCLERAPGLSSSLTGGVAESDRGVKRTATPPETYGDTNLPLEPPTSTPPLPPEGGDGGQEASPKEPKAPKPWTPGPIQRRINALPTFNRRDSTRWDPREIRAAKAIQFEEEDLKAIEAYYGAPKGELDRDIRRRDIKTLLNNWTGEVDRARAFLRGAMKPEPGVNGHGPDPRVRKVKQL